MMRHDVVDLADNAAATSGSRSFLIAFFMPIIAWVRLNTDILALRQSAALTGDAAERPEATP